MQHLAWREEAAIGMESAAVRPSTRCIVRKEGIRPVLATDSLQDP